MVRVETKSLVTSVDTRNYHSLLPIWTLWSLFPLLKTAPAEQYLAGKLKTSERQKNINALSNEKVILTLWQKGN